MLGNTRFISCVEHDIMFNTRNKSGISAHPCIILYLSIDFPVHRKTQLMVNIKNQGSKFPLFHYSEYTKMCDGIVNFMITVFRLYSRKNCGTKYRQARVFLLYNTGFEITFPTFPITAIGNHDFLPIK